VGVLVATWLAVRLGLGRLPSGTTWRHIVGLATTAGVGFTVALFVTSISFDSAATADAARVGILAGSTLAGLLGFTLLWTSPSPVAAGAGREAEPAADARTDAAMPSLSVLPAGSAVGISSAGG
jgi:Na+:H+ antiporter, NhaA family